MELFSLEGNIKNREEFSCNKKQEEKSKEKSEAKGLS